MVEAKKKKAASRKKKPRKPVKKAARFLAEDDIIIGDDEFEEPLLPVVRLLALPATELPAEGHYITLSVPVHRAVILQSLTLGQEVADLVQVVSVVAEGEEREVFDGQIARGGLRVAKDSVIQVRFRRRAPVLRGVFRCVDQTRTRMRREF